MIRWIRASVSGSTELVASSKTRILHPLTRARMSDTAASAHCSRVQQQPHVQSCFSPAEKLDPSDATSVSSLNFSLILILAEGFPWMRERASLSVASEEIPAGSMLSLGQSALLLFRIGRCGQPQHTKKDMEGSRRVTETATDPSY